MSSIPDQAISFFPLGHRYFTKHVVFATMVREVNYTINEQPVREQVTASLL